MSRRGIRQLVCLALGHRWFELPQDRREPALREWECARWCGEVDVAPRPWLPPRRSYSSRRSREASDDLASGEERERVGVRLTRDEAERVRTTIRKLGLCCVREPCRECRDRVEEAFDLLEVSP